MALDDIVALLREEAAEKVAQIDAEAQAAADEILDAARAEAAHAEAEAAAALDGRTASETEIISNRAVLQVERRLREAREAVYQEILDEALRRFATLRSHEDYPQLLEALLAECIEFSVECRTVMVDPRDAAAATRAMQALEVDAELEETLQTIGGLDIADGNGGFVRNTIEERLERAGSELRRRLGALVPPLRGGEVS